MLPVAGGGQRMLVSCRNLTCQVSVGYREDRCWYWMILDERRQICEILVKYLFV